MKINQRALALWAGGLALLVAGGVWLASVTEWATREVWQPARGEAATDQFFLFKRLLTDLGAQVTVQQGLATLPPDGATLVLQAHHWRFLPERAQAMQAWVERGGHLVAYSSVGDDPAITRPLGVRFYREKPNKPAAEEPAASDDAQEDEEAMDDGAMEDSTEGGDSEPATDDEEGSEDEDNEAPECPSAAEPPGQPGWYGEPRHYEFCDGDELLKSEHTPLWSVADERGLRALRLPQGHGTVTLSTAWAVPSGSRLLDNDQAVLLAALLQLRPGQQIWLVVDDESPGVVSALWRAAPAAVLLSLLALALLLWRWGTRFAPLRAGTLPVRRSMAEQVRGTAAWLLRRGPAALHQAQRRALEEAGAAHVPGWNRLSAAQRTAAMARHAGLSPDELLQALDPALPRDTASTGRALALMETARRRLAANAAGEPSSPHPPSP